MRSRMTAWLWISGCLVFAAGISAGLLVSKHLEPARSEHVEPIVAPISVSSPYLIASEEIFDELQLNGDQRATFSSVLAEHAKELGTIRASLGDLAAVLRERIHGIMTPEQLGRFQEIQSRYGKKEIQARVERELDRMRVEIALDPAHEPAAFRILYDMRQKKREIWKSRGDRDWKSCREQMEGLNAQQEKLLAEILSAEQLEKYREYRERDRKWWRERRRHHREKKDAEKAATPPAP